MAVQVGVAAAVGAVAVGQINADLVAEETGQALTIYQDLFLASPKCDSSELVGGRRPGLYTRKGTVLPEELVIGRLREERLGDLALYTLARDEPVNLSDSGSETHQHWPPADANCCQSLLLDPDAMIGIDLHKRLFLLVYGRGE